MSREVEKILVVKLGALGDFVLAFAAMKKIREAHPKARITLLTTPPYAALARMSPYFNDVETDGRPDSLAEWWEMVGRLRRARYDRVYDLQTSARSSRIYRALWPFAPKWSGVAWGASHRHVGRRRNHMHTLERQADQLRVAGIWPEAPTSPGEAPPPDLSWILRKHKAPAPVSGAPAPKPYAILVPGASAKRPEKRWPAEKFGLLAAALRQMGMDVVIVGATQESALARTIQKSNPNARDLTGRTDFAQIAVLAAKASLAVGNDTGPTHLIAAAGAPTVALFSDASDPALCGPRGHVAVLHSPNLADLPVDMVMRAVQSLLPQPRSPPQSLPQSP
jgi:ADP-heptose:LPS heptosyltransferase